MLTSDVFKARAVTAKLYDDVSINSSGNDTSRGMFQPSIIDDILVCYIDKFRKRKSLQQQQKTFFVRVNNYGYVGKQSQQA